MKQYTPCFKGQSASTYMWSKIIGKGLASLTMEFRRWLTGSINDEVCWTDLSFWANRLDKTR